MKSLNNHFNFLYDFFPDWSLDCGGAAPTHDVPLRTVLPTLPDRAVAPSIDHSKSDSETMVLRPPELGMRLFSNPRNPPPLRQVLGPGQQQRQPSFLLQNALVELSAPRGGPKSPTLCFQDVQDFCTASLRFVLSSSVYGPISFFMRIQKIVSFIL